MGVRSFNRALMLWLYVMVAFIGAAVVRAAAVDSIVIIDEINASGFPDVRLAFRVLDADNNVPSTLTNDEIALFENGRAVEQFEIHPPEPGPITVFYVIDTGQSANFRALMADQVRNSMLTLTDGFFRDGVDTVAILQRIEVDGRDETIIPLGPTQSVARFTSAVNSLDFSPTGRTEGLSAVEDALSRLSQMVQPGHVGATVIFISRVVEWPQQSVALRTAQTVAAAAREQRVKLYSFHTDSSFGEPLEALATRSDGRYLQLSVNRDASGDLNRIYEAIVSQGAAYSLTYRSSSGESGPRAVALAPAGSPVELASDVKTYDVSLQPASVGFLAPEDNAVFTRTASRTGDDSWNYDLDGIPVNAELITWPDGIPRTIAKVEFLAQEIVRHTVERPSGTTFNYNLDISGVEIPQAIVVRARVTDELGIQSETESITINVGIDRPEEVTVVVLPTQTPAPPPTPIIINEDPCAGEATSPECLQDRTLSYAPWGIVLILLVALVIYRRRLVRAAGVAGGALRERVAEVRHTVLGGSGNRGKKVLAVLRVEVARRDLQGKEIKIFTNRTTIGRNPKLCDIQLYDEDEVSSVSGQHCTIQFDRGRFLITDDNSANGTEVNGVTLQANSPRVLNQGDEIVLGDLFRRGAKLRFAATGAPARTAGAAASDATIVDEEFKTPSHPRGSETEVVLGSETVIGFSEDANDTMLSDRPIRSGREDEKDDDWLSDLE